MAALGRPFRRRKREPERPLTDDERKECQLEERTVIAMLVVSMVVVAIVSTMTTR